MEDTGSRSGALPARRLLGMSFDEALDGESPVMSMVFRSFELDGGLADDAERPLS